MDIILDRSAGKWTRRRTDMRETGLRGHGFCDVMRETWKRVAVGGGGGGGEGKRKGC